MTRQDARRYLVAYDISDDRRRLHVSRLLERYGDRVQYSVFVVDCSAARLVRLKTELAGAVRLNDDSVLLCNLGPAAMADGNSFQWIGRSRPITSSRAIIT